MPKYLHLVMPALMSAALLFPVPANAQDSQDAQNSRGVGPQAPPENDWAAEETIPAEISDDAAQIVSGMNAFSLEVYKATLKPAENHFLSGPSISTALAMAYTGARGQTRDQMCAVLHYPFAPSQLGQPLSELLSSMAIDGKGRTLSFNNSLWVSDQLELRPEYLAQTQAYFDAAARNVDYRNASDAVRAQINGWVEDKTNDKIKNLLSKRDVRPDTQSILVNTVYFKADWDDVFNETATEDKPFKSLLGEKILTPMMQQKGDFKIVQRKEVQAIALPYRGLETEMVIFLPKSSKGLPKFEAKLTPESLDGWIKDLDEAGPSLVDVSLPKFKLEAKVRLAQTLAGMGMPAPFANDADFSAMSGSALRINEVIHQTFLEVDEKGSEAAAATAVILIPITAISGPPPKPIIFKADRPFMFLIRDRRTDAILFMGRYVLP